MIRFFNTKKSDIPFILEMERHPENRDYVLQFSADQHQEIIKDPDKAHLKVVALNENVIGYIILNGLTNKSKSIELKRLVIMEKNKGFGKATLAELKKYCFETLQIHRLWLDVFDHNSRARHVYKSQGFVEEGMKREAVKTANGYENQIFMSILKSEYFAK